MCNFSLRLNPGTKKLLKRLTVLEITQRELLQYNTNFRKQETKQMALLTGSLKMTLQA